MFPTGGLHDSEAGVAGKGVLEDFAAGLAMEQAMFEELGASEGLAGGPPGPAKGACGFLRWSWLRPRWQQGLRGVRVGEAFCGGVFLEETGLCGGGLAVTACIGFALGALVLPLPLPSAAPGPGGGAAATEHRRQEYQMQRALVSIIELGEPCG